MLDHSFQGVSIHTLTLRASLIHNTILVSKSHYFGIVSALKKCYSPTTTLKLHNKSYLIILYIFNFLFVIYLILHFINKRSK